MMSRTAAGSAAGSRSVSMWLRASRFMYSSSASWSWGGVWGHSWSVDQTARTTILNLTNTTLEGMVGQLVRDVQAAVYG